jgi:hypothetical protein
MDLQQNYVPFVDVTEASSELYTASEVFAQRLFCGGCAPVDSRFVGRQLESSRRLKTESCDRILTARDAIYCSTVQARRLQLRLACEIGQESTSSTSKIA